MNNFTQNNWNGDNIMNFGKQPRKLTAIVEEQLKKIITNGAEVDVTSILGDNEAFNFASQIKDFLEKSGYTVKGVNQAVYTKPITGQIIEPPQTQSKIYKIIIGSNE